MKAVETERGMVVARGGGKGDVVFNGVRVSFGDDEKVLETDGGDGCVTVGAYSMPLNAILRHG